MKNETLNEGSLKRLIIYTILVFRIILIIVLFVKYNNKKLIQEDFDVLLCGILPGTILYIVLVLKYVITHKRYVLPGNLIDKGYFGISFLPLLILHVAELTALGCSSAFDQASGLYTSVMLCECGLCAYAGFYLSTLFVKNENS